MGTLKPSSCVITNTNLVYHETFADESSKIFDISSNLSNNFDKK